MMNQHAPLPTFYIPHGGGPCFDMEWPPPMQKDIDRLGAWLGQVKDLVGVRPRAILMVTAHWETAEFTVDTNPKPSMIYDYTGFPAHTYQLKYDAPGSPEVAQQVIALIEKAGIPVRAENRRGFDHGTFVPLRKMYPDAELPVVQLSIKRSMDPKAHLELGRALIPLREHGILIIGSGMSYHNFAGFNTPEGTEDSVAFDQWLTEVVESEPSVRNQKLSEWDLLPLGRKAHPEEDHLIPLMVIAGAAGDDRGQQVFSGPVLGTVVSAYQFGQAAARFA